MRAFVIWVQVVLSLHPLHAFQIWQLWCGWGIVTSINSADMARWPCEWTGLAFLSISSARDGALTDKEWWSDVFCCCWSTVYVQCCVQWQQHHDRVQFLFLDKIGRTTNRWQLQQFQTVSKQYRGKAAALELLCHHVEEIAFGSGRTIEQVWQLIFDEEKQIVD